MNHGTLNLTDAPAVKLPGLAERIAGDFPELWSAYQAFGEAAKDAGPLDPRGRRLVHLAFALGEGLEGAAHSHLRRALSEGIAADELEHVALLAATTLGWPRAIRALAMVHDVTDAGATESAPGLLACFGY